MYFYIPLTFSAMPQVFPRLRYFQYLSYILLRHQWSMMMKSYQTLRLFTLVLGVFNDYWFIEKAVPIPMILVLIQITINQSIIQLSNEELSMPVRNTTCTPVFMMCMPMFNRKLRKVIKSVLVANVHRGKLKFNEADYVMA